MTLNVWPIDLFRGSADRPELVGRLVGGGQSLSGLAQVVRTDGGGLWRLTYRGILLTSADEVRAWHAWEGILDGGAQNVIVPYCDLRHAPRPIVDGVAVLPGPTVPHSDDAYFSDTTGYATPLMEIETVGTAALRATEIDLRVVVGEALRGGELFSLTHPTVGDRFYRVVKVVETIDGVTTVKIRPPLREATTDAMVADFDRPRCVMRLEQPDGMAADLDGKRFIQTDVTFIESF